jgi:hypothetical protein
MKHIIFKKLGAKPDNYKSKKYLKEFVVCYFYHLIEQKVFVSKYVTFLEKEFVLEMSNERKIEVNEVQEPQIDIQIEQEPKAITFDVQLETQ